MVTFSFLVAIFSWLLPLFITLKRNKVNLTHPIIIFPFFVVFSIIVPFSEFLFGWSNKFDSIGYGLRYISAQIISEGGVAYIITNLYLIISSFFYFLGCFFANKKKLIPNYIDFIEVSKSKKSQIIHDKIFKLFFLIPLLIIPFLLMDFGKLGGYFTYIITTLIYFLPSLFVFISIPNFVISFLTVTPFLFLTLSKGNVFYLFLWSAIPFDYLRTNFSVRLLLIISSFSFAIPLINSAINNRAALGIEASTEDTSFVYAFFYREYGYDSLAGDIYNSLNNQKEKSVSYIASNIKELIPSSIHESIFGETKMRMGNIVGYEVFKENKASDSGVGFNRYFLLDFYHDFGFIGIPIISFFYGWCFMFWYKKNISSYIKTLDRFYLMRYLSLCMNAHFLINGLLYYAVTTFVGMNVLIYFFQRGISLKFNNGKL